MRDREKQNGRQVRESRGVVPARGQALVEFVIVIPLMLLLMLVAVDFGRLFFSYIAVNNAAREATNYASVHAADTPFVQSDYEAGAAAAGDAEANVQGQGGEGSVVISAPVCFDPLSNTSVSCDVAANYATGIGNQVTVTAQQEFSFLTPLVGDLFGGELNLQASSTAPVLNPQSVTILPGPSSAPTTTPTASATASPSPTPSLPPGATPTPTPTPSPPPTCIVPNFFNQSFNAIDLQQAWHDTAGFTGTITDTTGGKKIKSQTLPAGSTQLCSSSMTVDDKN